MTNRLISLIALGALFASCQATPLNPQASRVRMTTVEPKGCQYLGEVTGYQGGSLEGKYTSNQNLEIGARNDMKNKASAMGGNIIVMLSNRAAQTGSYSMYGGSNQQTDVAYTGTVFNCKATATVASNANLKKK